LVETTTLALAAAKKASLRTTVPMSIVKQFDLKPGDRLNWSFDIRDGEMIIIVNPVKMGETE
jgi:hypothetical protein